MRKLAILALAMVVSGGAFAQDKVWKKALSMGEGGKTVEALEMIKPALESAETKDKAGAYNALAKIYYKQYLVQATIQTENVANKQMGKEEKPVDVDKMHQGLYEAFKAFIKSDEFDMQPDEKGRVKPKYRVEVSKTYYSQRPQLINAGQYYYQNKDNENAKKMWGLYLDTKNVPLFADHTEVDQYAGQIAYYVCFLSYQTKDFDTYKKYISIGLADPEQASACEEISIAMLQNRYAETKAAEDSVAFLNAAIAAHQKYPDVQRYFDVIARCYATKPDVLVKFMDEEIAKNPNVVLPYLYKGEMAMNNQKWDEAIENYKKAAANDANNIIANYNLGVCYYNKANNLKDELADKKTGKLTDANADKVRNGLTEALTYLEKTRQLDPEQETCRWAYILANTYYVRGEQAKYEEVSKLIKQ